MILCMGNTRLRDEIKAPSGLVTSLSKYSSGKSSSLASIWCNLCRALPWKFFAWERNLHLCRQSMGVLHFGAVVGIIAIGELFDVVLGIHRLGGNTSTQMPAVEVLRLAPCYLLFFLGRLMKEHLCLCVCCLNDFFADAVILVLSFGVMIQMMRNFVISLVLDPLVMLTEPHLLTYASQDTTSGRC